jgi:hypothetical protein
MSNLILPPYAACVFVDDTGHEDLAGTSFYGLGACAVLGCEYDRLIRAPWSHVRNVVNGDPAAPLHASDLTGRATPEQLHHIAQFFREQPFGWLGATGTSTTILPDGEPLMRFVVEILKPRIVDVLKWMPFTSIIIVFEDNPRANRLIEQYFGNVQFQADGKAIPAEFYFMPKSSGDPALEVADFIANAIGNQARFKQVDKMPGFRKDFQAVFHDIDPKLASFMGIEKVEIAASHHQPTT